jgi:phage terminase large subunit-like protein
MTTLDPSLLSPENLAWLRDHRPAEEVKQIWPALKEALETAKYEWSTQARPEQLPPDGEWLTWLILAGRGWGKSRTGAEWIKTQALANPGTRWAVIAPTYADARDTCVEGESGLLSVLPKSAVANWNRSMGELQFANGSRVKLFSGDEPDRLRGPQHHGAWFDELGAFRYPEAWDQAQFGLRLGTNPQAVVTTTPKPTKLIRELVQRSGVVVTRGSTFDNAANLAPAALAELKARYEGTRLGRQELYAELLLDVPGALFTFANIDANRVSEAPDLVRITVNVDPSGGAGPENDEQGITVTARGVDGHGYVFDDRSCSLSPNGWGRRAVQAYIDYEADVIVVEKNYGGDMAVATIEQAARDMGAHVNVKTVTSSRGKVLRAEPIAALYEQGRIHHVGAYKELEEQMCSWTPDSGTSPDRLDSLVFGLSDLFLENTAKPRSRFRGA